jgi:catechol 2,3-dioxygenase-like lactoylglutathione lyase family enzyme
MPILHHTGLTVVDLDRSLHFWRDAMAMDVLFQQEKAGGYMEAIVGEPGAHVRMAHLALVVLGLHRTIDLTLSPGRIVHRHPDGPA